jgi:hypothetical protein
MHRSADVLDQPAHPRVRSPRIRRPRTLRIKMLKPGEEAPLRRTNPHGWKHANAARRWQGRERTEVMARRWAAGRCRVPPQSWPRRSARQRDQSCGRVPASVSAGARLLRPADHYHRPTIITGPVAPPHLRVEYTVDAAEGKGRQ